MQVLLSDSGSDDSSKVDTNSARCEEAVGGDRSVDDC